MWAAIGEGYFEEEGLNVSLEAQANWKVLLDRVISGELDGAHMLAGQPIGATPTCCPEFGFCRRRRRTPVQPRLVYARCMARTNIDIDEVACEVVMDRYHLRTKRDAVNLALRLVAGEALDLDEARAMRGSGWDADLDELRSSRVG